MLNIWTTVFISIIIVLSLVILIIVSLIMGGVITTSTSTTINGISTTTELDPLAWYWIVILVLNIFIFVSCILSFFVTDKENISDDKNIFGIKKEIPKEIPKETFVTTSINNNNIEGINPSKNAVLHQAI